MLFRPLATAHRLLFANFSSGTLELSVWLERGTSVTRHLKATRSYHGFVTHPQEGWERDPHTVRDQEAAVAFLS
jgi:hypothetical protein